MIEQYYLSENVHLPFSTNVKFVITCLVSTDPTSLITSSLTPTSGQNFYKGRQESIALILVGGRWKEDRNLFKFWKHLGFM